MAQEVQCLGSKMKRHAIIMSLVASGCLFLLTPARAVTNTLAHTYPSGARIAGKIGNDLYATLDPKFQTGLNPEAVSLEKSAAPVIAPVRRNGQGFPAQVSVSTGFIDLLNHIAHAKAIDRIQPGYLGRYVSELAQPGAEENPPLPPNLDNPRYWTEAVMTDQASYFNQMISLTLAINLSHHYLAHYHKYAAQMPEGKPAPINKLIAPVEWDASVRCATLNSLDCALATEGGRALFAFIDQMPRRPAWTDYIVPQGVNITRLNAQLSDYETDYFRGGLKLRNGLVSLSVASIQTGAD
jgi:hypothetical protein